MAYHGTNPAITFIKEQTKVLVVEDEGLFAKAVVRHLDKAGYICEHVETIQSARNIINQFTPDIMLLDMRLPDGNGFDLISEYVARNIAVIVMTAHGEISDAVNAMKLGALDYLKKPVDLNELLISIQKVKNLSSKNNSLDLSKQRNAHAIERVELLGKSSEMQNIRNQIKRVAQIFSTDAVPPTLLITGETGTGKDIVARSLHLSCARSDKPFIHVDCASLPAELIESELFGYEKGAFTGATDGRPGLIEAAEDGTLFLDEIGEMPLSLQAKLLNVLERRAVRRIGSNKERSVLARFIAATNRDLYQMSLDGRFRLDLYYRLHVITIYLPALRDRPGDLLLLAQRFVEETTKRYKLPQAEFAEEAISAIQKYSWPGNVRELKHTISRAVMLSHGSLITEKDLALPGVIQINSNTPLDQAEKAIMVQALAEANNNVSKAARNLGITRMTMRYRMEKHGLK